MLAATSVLGCVACDLVPVPNSTVVPTVGPSSATTAPTETPTPQASTTLPIGLVQYSTGTPPDAHMANDVLVSHPYYYARPDLSLPQLPEGYGSLQPASHGVIHEVDFWNPTTSNQTIDVNYFPSAFIETFDGKGSFVSPEELFYDPNIGFFSDFTLAPGEHRTLYIYAYITDQEYNEYHGMFTVGGLTITMFPPTD